MSKVETVVVPTMRQLDNALARAYREVQEAELAYDRARMDLTVKLAALDEALSDMEQAMRTEGKRRCRRGR
jgi:hypothetical protein